MEDQALEVANSIQLCNVAFKQVNKSLKRHHMNPILNVLKIPFLGDK